MKHILLILFFLFSFNVFSQEEKINTDAVDNYKYVIVPLKYELFEDKDKYQINSLTKFLFNKYGYNAYFENEELPSDYLNNNCLGLKVDVVKVKGGFLSIKLKINLVDCKGQLVVSSEVGKSKEKEFKVAYNLALRDAFKTFQNHKYKYKPNKVKTTSSSITSNVNSNQTSIIRTKQKDEEIERLKQEVAALKEEKETKETTIEPVIESKPEKQVVEKVDKFNEDIKLLYAQPIKNGFQVVDHSPKVVMILLETPKENTFIVKDQNAIVYKEDGFWYLSKNDGTSTSLETLNIKF